VRVSAASGRLGVGNDPRYNKTRCFETFPLPAPDGPEKERIGKLAEELDALRKARQALHPGLTLTGMYNVFEQLRRGEPLTAKDKVIHEQGLVSVLRQLHDELDAAVLAAYGWQDLIPALLHRLPVGSAVRTEALAPGRDLGVSPPLSVRAADPTGDAEVEEEILRRLVALNAERAAEERRGLVRWLRPDFQNRSAAVSPAPGSVGVPPTTGSPGVTPGVGKDLQAPWPKTLPDQFQALRSALAAHPGPATPADLAQGFARAPRAKVAELLATLASLGHARCLDDGRYLPG
jgi:hypothetical protein